MRPSAHFAIAIATILGARAAPTYAQTDFGSWHSVAFDEREMGRVTLSGYVQVRLHDDSSELRQLYLSQLVDIEAHERIGLGINYTYLPTRSALTGDFLYQHRIELEAIPRWPAGNRLRFDVRNRLEIRWLEGKSGTNERSRHRAQGRYVMPDRGRLTAVFANNEFFYDWDESKYNENRLTPVGLTFRLYGEVGVDLYYMVQSLETSGRWTHTHLLGTHLTLAW